VFVYLAMRLNCTQYAIKLLFLHAVFFSSLAFGQDTATYCKRNSPWVSDYIRLYRPSPSATSGLFIRSWYSDDCQRWYGSGNFKQSNRKLLLDGCMCTRMLCHIKNDSVVWDHFAVDSSVAGPLTFKIKKNGLKLSHRFKKPTYFDLKRR